MKIEIWSDILCPYCYIAKKQLEKALELVHFKTEINVVWKSFELNPDIQFDPAKSMKEYLSEVKHISIEEVARMQQKLIDQGSQLGINFQFDKAPVSNSHNAHKLLHWAQKQHKGSEIKEELFYQYFTEGKDIGDVNILIQIAKQHKLKFNTDTPEHLFYDESLTEEIIQDRYEAQQIGIRGVPFFIFNDHYTLSGAHPSDTLYKILETIYLKRSIA
jgi:predicted DsbA family dithiol-disulfide isomerase